MKSRRIISFLLLIVMLLGCILPMAACKKVKNEDNGDDGTPDTPPSTDGGNNGEDVPPPAPGKTNYVIKVVTTGGMPLEGIQVYVHKGEEDFNLAARAQLTDENGTTVFELETADNYSVELVGVPDGYNVKSGETRAERYDMGVGGATIRLHSSVIQGKDLPASYKVGDVINDFTYVSSDGVTYTLSELLKTKDMVMLNYWYEGCGNCATEFPVINSVYEAYSDDIEILALNDYKPDDLETVEGYREFLGINLKFPLFKIGNDKNDMTLSKYDSEGYPTTVIIDRYGVICLIEVGAVTGESKWKNLFDHFTAENYEQKLYTSINELSPIIEPNIEWQGHDSIASVLNRGDVNVTYSPETSEKDAKYSWPFAATEYNGIPCVAPTNKYDNSYAIMYADIALKPEEAVMVDFLSSCEYLNDRLYVIVDGKDIISVTGVNESGEWDESCIFVDPRIKNGENNDEERIYSIGFVYRKDDENSKGDDTVYMKDLRVIHSDDIPVPTYIYRYAATDPDEFGENYTYVDVVLGDDKYYHVGSKTGPLLLVNHLGYTVFDGEKTISQRMYEAGELAVGGEDKFALWEMYGNFGANSNVYGYTPVTEELREILEAYVEKFRTEDGIIKDAGENLWLELCSYYGAYGRDENGNVVKEMADPIIGLSTFSAFEAVMDDPDTPEKETNTVKYDKVIIPRGYLYKFTAPTSGVYRVTSSSVTEVNGWILTGTSQGWLENENGERTVIADFEEEERVCEELTYLGEDGNYYRDLNNVSLVVYLNAGESCYIDIAYYDVYATGEFTFDIKYIGEKFAQFSQASPGPITFELTLEGGMGQMVALGQPYIFAYDTELNDGIKYAYHVRGYDENGNPILGEKLYADFYYPTVPFSSQSILDLIKASAFNFSITENDRQALIYLETIRLSGKKELMLSWARETVGESIFTEYDLKNVIKNGKYSDDDKKAEKQKEYLEDIQTEFASIITENAVDEIILLVQKGEDTSAYAAQYVEYAEFAVKAGTLALKETWGKALITEETWKKYDMTNVLSGIFSSDEATRREQEKNLELVNAEFASNWSKYKMDDVKLGIYHTSIEDTKTSKDKKAIEYLEIYNNGGSTVEAKKAAIVAKWNEDFDFLVPEKDTADTNGDGELTLDEISEWRYNYLWNEFYQMDDIIAGKYHGTNKDYTADILRYVEAMEKSDSEIAETFPERLGCVAVTEELANLLHLLYEKEVFEDVKDDWLKFCFYYKLHGYEM